MIRIAIYVRVSTQEQAKEGYSIGEQTERLQKYSEANRWKVIKIYTDAGFSGSNQNRPALQDLISDVKAGRIDKVLVYKLDRLSRSQKDTLELIEDVFLKNNCDFESMTERFDTSTSFGKAMIGILAVFAQLERQQIKERMSMGLDARIKEGKWRGGAKVPFGYNYDPVQEILIINEWESMIVKYIFKEFINGTSVIKISNNMTDTGYSFRNGSTDTRKIKYILSNKTYCGYLKSKNNWYKGKQEAIIDEETFNKAQIIIQENKRRFKESGRNCDDTIASHLGGLIYCANCGAKYCRVRSGTEKYGFHFNYICYSRSKRIKHMIKDPNCQNKYYRVDVLDEIIFNEIRKLAIDPEYLKSVHKNSDKQFEQEQIKAIHDELKSITNQISRFMDLYGLGKYDIEQLDQKTQPLTVKKLQLQQKLQELQEESKQMSDKQIVQLVKSFDEALKHGTFQDRRQIIETLIDQIEIDNDDITIHWNFT